MKQHEYTETIKSVIDILPCIKCGNEDIEIYNCNYSSFNCSGGKCKKCGNSVETHMDWTTKNYQLIAEWNRANDPVALIIQLTDQRDNLNKEINRLRKIEKKYKNAVQ